MSEMSIKYDEHFKIIFIGDQGVGKSSLLNRYINGKFLQTYQATIGVDYRSKHA